MLRNTLLSALLLALLSGPLRAQGAAGDARFAGEAGAVHAVLDGSSFTPSAAPKTGLREELSRRLDGLLGMFDALLRQPGFAADEMSRKIRAGFAASEYKGLVLGESHSVPHEIASGERFIREAVADGRVGLFLKERNTFKAEDILEDAGIVVKVMSNQFAPVDDVKKGVKKARPRFLAVYAGHAHTCDRLKDYLLYTLLEGRRFGYGRGGKDMPTIEDGFKKSRKRPVIVAMMTEERILRVIRGRFLKEAVGDGTDLATLVGRLELTRDVWRERLTAYPPRLGPIYFVEDPDQDNLFYGLTPSGRDTPDISAALDVLGGADLAAWLGGSRIRLVESLRGSNATPAGVPYTYHHVIVHREDGERFEKTVNDPARPAFSLMSFPPTYPMPMPEWGDGFPSDFPSGRGVLAVP